MKTLNNELTTFLKSRGASLVGFANLGEIAPDARDGFPFGISIAIALNPQIMAEINEGPTKQYHSEYKRLNTLLDELGQSTVKFLGEKGHRAKVRLATFKEDEATLSAKLPHKTVATRSGLGWIGKCDLLITREFGSAIRLNTVLTDALLVAGKPVNKSSCGDCVACVDICPGHVPIGQNWKAGLSRESLLHDVFVCRDTARGLSLKLIGESLTICGLCIVACPWTKKYITKV